jgi:hypothetical protein
MLADLTHSPARPPKPVGSGPFHPCHRHIVMVNVEADVLAGPLLAKKAKEAGLIYSLAYGDQPAIICETEATFMPSAKG